MPKPNATTPTASGAQPHPGQTRALPEPPARLPLASLTFDPAFSPRKETSKPHVQDLARSLRNGGDLEPISVWQDTSTGRWVILDGRHRATAYRLEGREDIPVWLFQGDRKAARLEAARDNSKARFPWTTSECTQYAWGLVIEAAGSKRKIADYANVRTSTVANMRKRLAEMTTAGKVPTGNWWADRTGKTSERPPEDDSDGARKARLDRLREGMNGTETRFRLEFGRGPTMEEFGTAMRWHLGQPRFKAMASGGYLVDEDEFSDSAEARPLAPHPGNPDEDF
jgi:hypothetical protein